MRIILVIRKFLVLIGEDGTGKIIFTRMWAGNLQLDGDVELPGLQISYNRRRFYPNFKIMCGICYMERHVDPQLIVDVVKPMKIEAIMDKISLRVY